MIHYVSGNIFDSPAQTLVNPVNTVGVMGKGLALEFKKNDIRKCLRNTRNSAVMDDYM